MPSIPKDKNRAVQAKPDRIYVNNYDLSELKLTCDEAVERILTRSRAGGDAVSGDAAKKDADDADNFSPFTASHFHGDLRLLLGFVASVIMIGTTLWAYFIEKEWEKNKFACGVAVATYTVLSAIQAIDSYWQGNTIFVGKRKMLSKRIETESLKIVSPALPRATKKPNATKDGKPVLEPPVYSVQIDYTRKSNGGKSLLGSKKDTLALGHMGEWFTEDGEFVEEIFEERLLSGLQKAFGQ
ncbi:hypothetical protein ACQY0O_002028 [Thecaphora frezii]